MFFQNIPDLAAILGDVNFDFDHVHFSDFFGFQISRFSGSQISRFPEICPGLGLGQAWAMGQVGPWVGPRVCVCVRASPVV